MIDKFQCQTHTRTPWGKNPHRYDYRLRYLAMGLLCASVLTIFIVGLVLIGDRAIQNFQLIPSDESPTTSAEPPFPTWNVTDTNTTAKTTAKTTLYYKSGRIT